MPATGGAFGVLAGDPLRLREFLRCIVASLRTGSPTAPSLALRAVDRKLERRGRVPFFARATFHLDCCRRRQPHPDAAPAHDGQEIRKIERALSGSPIGPDRNMGDYHRYRNRRIWRACFG